MTEEKQTPYEPPLMDQPPSLPRGYALDTWTNKETGFSCVSVAHRDTEGTIHGFSMTAEQALEMAGKMKAAAEFIINENTKH